jgi:hypothetical protein
VSKPVVHYIQRPGNHIVVGGRAVVWPIDHYATDRVSNTRPASTSEVLRHDRETGEFETLNTIYRPQEAA